MAVKQTAKRQLGDDGFEEWADYMHWCINAVAWERMREWDWDKSIGNRSFTMPESP